MLANGGRAIDRTKDVSPELEKICVTAAKAVGLQYAGIDLLLKTNGNTILTPDNYKIIEVNMFPGHILNESPLVENATVNVSAKILEFLLKQ
jgi:cyanophycin synthetase